MTVVTRFAPSPTGFLHIGGARTALFNWLYARHTGGEFLLRIEDTDRKRSTTEAIDAIFDGLDWLGLTRDGADTYQSRHAGRHAQVAHDLLEAGGAYHCYCTPAELTEMREAARAAGRHRLYDGRWRDRDRADARADVAPVVRFRAPQEGETVIEDAVQGPVRVGNEQLDDMVLLRADGTPTYMLSVVVDDHDMAISHVIRGDDHLTNAFRQTQLFHALGWEVPVYGHIPLIHGADGAKLSKRHGALGVDAYRAMGILPEALLNYLMRLGWSHGDEEIISLEQAIDWFDITQVGRAAARLDLDKLTAVNAHYLHRADSGRLLNLMVPGLQAAAGCTVGPEARQILEDALPGLIPRAKTINELIENSLFYVRNRPLQPDAKAARLLNNEARDRLRALRRCLAALEDWSENALEAAVRDFTERENIKLGQVAQPLRAALTGSAVSPGIFQVAAVLGRAETLGRLDDVQATEWPATG